MAQQGPREPLEELERLRQEIARLQHQIAVKDAALHVAREWLQSGSACGSGCAEVDLVLLMAINCAKMERKA